MTVISQNPSCLCSDCACCTTDVTNATFATYGITDKPTGYPCFDCNLMNKTFTVPLTYSSECRWDGDTGTNLYVENVCAAGADPPLSEEDLYEGARFALSISSCPTGSGDPPKILLQSSVTFFFNSSPTHIFGATGTYHLEVEIDPESIPVNCLSLASGIHNLTEGSAGNCQNIPTTLDVTYS